MSKNKQIAILLMGALAGVAVFAVGCQPKGATPQRTVGVILPLTGDAAAYGKSMRQGMELALGQVNGKSASPLALIYEDSKADPKEAVTAYRNLVSTRGVPAILGPFTSGETLAVAPLAEKDHVVVLSTGASAPAITTAGDFTFRIVTSDTFDGDVVARFATSNLHLNKPAVVYVNNDYGVGVRDSFSKRLQQLGGSVTTSEGYLPTDPDFRTLLAKVKATNPDGLMLFGYKEMGKILKQARETGLNVPVVSTGLFEDPEILKAAGDAAEGVYYSFASYNPATTNRAVAEFVTAYKAAYSVEPDILAALGYDAVRVINQAYPEPKLSGEQIRDDLYKIQSFPGAAGDMTFDKNGDVAKSFGIKKVQDGKFTWVIDNY